VSLLTANNAGNGPLFSADFKLRNISYLASFSICHILANHSTFGKVVQQVI